MKRRDFIASLLVLLGCKEENIIKHSEVRVNKLFNLFFGGLSPLGVIYNKSSFADLTDFTVNGVVTPTVSGNTINFTGGTDVYTNTIDLTSPYTMLENWTMTVQAKITSGAKTGFYIGSRAQSSAPHALFGYFSLDKIGIAAGSTVTLRGSEASLVTSVNDVIELVLTKSHYDITLTGRNVTTGGATSSTTYTFVTTSAASEPLTPNTGRFCIGTRSSTFSVLSYYVYSSVPIGARIAIVGDSIVEGYGASTYDTAFARLTATTYPTTIIHAGENDRTSAVLLRIPQLIQLNPQYVILSIGVNDLVNGISVSTIMTNVASIVSQLQAVNITVYHLLNYSTVSNIASYRDSLLQTYPGKTIDPNLYTAGNYIADNIHPNDTGHLAIKDSIVASGYFATVSAIDPSTLSPIAWWKNGVGMASDGSQWTDSQGNYNLTAAGSAKPTYNASSQNSLPSYTFNGSANVFTGARITQMQGAAKIVMWAVGKRFCLAHYGSTGTTARTELVHLTSDDKIYGLACNSGTTYGAVQSSNAFHYCVLVYDGAKASGTIQDRLRVYINGVETFFTTFPGSIPATSENDATAIIHMGKFFGGFTGGEVCDAGIITGTLLTPAQIAGLNAYLKNTFAL